MLIDCGEGTQVQLAELGLSVQRLDAVCITHLHGDHLFGLPGLLTSMTLSGRERNLHLIGPPALEAYVQDSLRYAHAALSFELNFLPVNLDQPEVEVLRLRELSLATLPLLHRVPTTGFCVSTINKGRHLRKGVVMEHKLKPAQIEQLRNGRDVSSNTGETLLNAELTTPPTPTRALAYLTDTAVLSSWPMVLPRPDLLIHDATFVSEDAELAKRTGHSTALEAAAFAKTSGAHTLLLTHRSPRYKKEAHFLADAAPYSGDLRIELAEQGKAYEVPV